MPRLVSKEEQKTYDHIAKMVNTPYLKTADKMDSIKSAIWLLNKSEE